MTELRNRFVEGHRGTRALGVLLLGLGAFLWISLVSYSPEHYPNASRVVGTSVNWGGVVGAWTAYIAVQGVGYAAYILPVLALLWGGELLRGVNISSAVHRSLGLSCMALLLCVASGLPRYSPSTAFQLGGWLGTQTCNVLLVPYIGRIGSAVLLTALLVAALILTTDIRLAPILRVVARSSLLLRATALRLLLAPVVSVRRFGEYLSQRRLARRAKRGSLGKERGEDREEERDDEEGTPLVPVSADGGARQPAVQISTPPPAADRQEQADTDDVATSDSAAAKIPSSSASAPPAAGEGPKVGSPPETHSRAGRQRSAKTTASGGSASVAQSAGEPNATKAAAATPRYQLPGVDLMDEVPKEQGKIDEDSLLANARLLEQALGNFDVSGKVVEVSPGPVVTRYEVEPAAGVKVNRIVTLSDDLARVMSATGIRIQAPVPGKSVVGIEIANQDRETVYLREILEANVFRKAESKLTMALGKTISGEPFATDLAKMPHLLVAGATGAGKSVCINSLICSMLFKSTPEEVRFLMVDPKVVELTMYNDIPHLLVPVITEPKKAAEALKWAVAEMEVRYRKLAKMGVRNLTDYNARVAKLGDEPDEDGVEPPTRIPFIVIVIDEFADLMLTAPADVETSLMMLAQKSRAVGIHIILATQRPSVNVITGVIKANFPSRIAFQVATKTDSRTILDMNGAERLLGRGDMLFLPGGQGEPLRVHGAFVSSEETEALVQALKESEYQADEVAVFGGHVDINATQSTQDELFDEAVRIVMENQQASTSYLQRRMKIGYSRAARLMDELEGAGVVGPADGAKPRQILITEGPTGEGMQEEE